MSLPQNTFVDYTNLGDTGTSTAGSIQPLTAGEAASAPNLGRAPENLRSRTEITRDVVEDLLYARDAAAARYLIDVSGGGLLSWEVGGVGRVNNTTALSLRPFVGPQADVKGTLYIGTAASNQLRYTVAAGAYASDGMNAITVEHRSVTGTVTPVVTISAAPVRHILVVFDAANTGHDASAVSALLASAIAGVAALAGRLVVTTSAVPATAILATAGRVPLNVRTHSGGLSGGATADLEEHTLTAGALGTFTTTTPLTEGDLLAIRYDYVVEDGGTGGRAQSNVAAGSADVAANLFVAQAHPEWLPGCIPLCKVLHGRLVWVDGTVLPTGASMTPGSTYATYFDPTGFSGLPTQSVNGGIDTAIDTTVQAALTSIDQRLSQSRYATWTATDGTNSTGGHYDGVGAVTDAVAASTNGGDVVVRRGVYTTALPAITITSGGLKLRGETHDGSLTSRTRMTAASSTTVNADVTLENLAYLRAGAFTTTLSRAVALRNVTLQAGALTLSAAAGHSARFDNVTMLNSVSTGDHATAALCISALRTHVTNSNFVGPDPLSTGTKPCVWQSSTTAVALYENCTFTSTKVGCLPFAFEGTVNETTFVNCTFRLEGSPGSYVVDFDGLSLGGTVKFVGCRFTNVDGFAVIRARPVTGTVIFDNCMLYANGSPDGIAVGAQSVVVFAPLTAAKVVVRSCTATVTETNFTNIARPLTRIGGSETGGCAGTLKVDGFDLVLAGVGTALPASACVLFQGGIKCSYTNVTVDVAGKRAPATTLTIPANDGAGYIMAGLFSGRAPRLRDFTILGADAPLVTASATTITGWLFLNAGHLDGFTVNTVSVPSGNTFRSATVWLQNSTLQNARIPVLAMHNTVAVVNLTGGTTPAIIEQSTLYRGAVAGGVSVGYCLFTVDGGTVRAVAFREALTALPYIVSCLDTLSIHNTIDACDFVIETATRFVTAAFSASGDGIQITNNNVLTWLDAPSELVNVPGTLDRFKMVGNSFQTAGAVASACVPNPSTVVATAVSAVSNNTFRTTSSVPS